MNPIQRSIIDKVISCYNTGEKLILSKEETEFHLNEVKKIKKILGSTS